ncbi:hypothetical protein SCA6_011071 [Theobroma cacao]
MTCRFSLLHPFSFTNTSNSYVETNLNRQVVLGYMFLSAPQARPWVKLFIDTQQPMPRSFFNMITQPASNTGRIWYTIFNEKVVTMQLL